jgi:uncharacterized protein (DUF433 family)
MKYVAYKDPWHGPGKYEVRTEPGERTVAHCSSREEAKRIAHALNTKSAWVSPEELVERAQAQAQPTVVTDPEILSGTPVFAGSRVPIDMVLACVDAGNDMARIRHAYPFVTDEHITAARATKRRTEHPRSGKRPRLLPSSTRASAISFACGPMPRTTPSGCQSSLTLKS